MFNIISRETLEIGIELAGQKIKQTEFWILQWRQCRMLQVNDVLQVDVLLRNVVDGDFN